MFPASRPNAYTGSPLDRAGHLRDDEGAIGVALASEAALFVPVWRAKSLMQGVEAGCPRAVLLQGGLARALREAAGEWAFLGLFGEAPVFALDLSAAEDVTPLLPTPAHSFTDLRSVAGLLPAGEAAILAHARGLMHWRTRHRFCGVCGAACAAKSAGTVMVCTRCEAQHFPRTDPAVIMLVWKGDRALLGHNHRFPLVKMYSTLAGFVEPGESFEEAVAREVFEESGVRVGQVAYHSSQPWPFPSSIMIGFHAEALTEAITVDESELKDARWFSRAELRDPASLGIQLPRLDSIARRLIEDYLAG
ncbi:MAG: NAD(+) diphosphatase [Acetobacteraceae bacterium]|nr:NAD(+) diphosphatase [Acetobacteraceae bacterium]